MEKHSKRNMRFTFFALMLSILMFYIPQISGDLEYFGEDARLFLFLSSLPKDILIAGHPEEMNNIPLFAKRKVLVTEELALPVFSGFYNEMRQRTYDFFQLYYASSPLSVQRILNKYKIDYIVVYKKHFSEEFLTSGIYYLSPYNDFVKGIIKKNRDRFILLKRGIFPRVYEDERLFVLRARGSNKD